MFEGTFLLDETIVFWSVYRLLIRIKANCYTFKGAIQIVFVFLLESSTH